MTGPLSYRLPILWCNQLEKLLFTRGVAEPHSENSRAFIGPGHLAALEVPVPMADMRKAFGTLQALFALTQRGLGLLPLGDVREQTKKPSRSSRIIMDGHAGNADPYWRSIGSAESKIEWPAVTGQSTSEMTLRLL